MAFGFDLIDLRLVVNIVETLSLTRGAERSFLSAPAASARIKKMEEALRAQLFYRTTQGLVPTASGHTVLRYATTILCQADEMESALHGQAESMKGSVRLFANTLSITELLPPALQVFLLTFPDVNIDMQEMGSSAIARALRQGIADVGILAVDAPESGLEYLPYRDEPLVVIAAPSHSLAGATSLRFTQIRGFNYVGLKESVALQAFIARAAAREGFEMKLRIQANDFESLCNLVQSGIGIAVVPESVARRQAQRLRIVPLPLQDDWSIRRLMIAVHDMQSLTAPARALIDVLQASTKPAGGG
jgi:DNA-binding transcriptional LysR family regulator